MRLESKPVLMQRTSAGVVLARMERIDVTSGRPPSVDRPEGSKALFLTFDGLRNAKVRDKDTRVRIALQARRRYVCGVCSASACGSETGHFVTDNQGVAEIGEVPTICYFAGPFSVTRWRQSSPSRNSATRRNKPAAWY